MRQSYIIYSKHISHSTNKKDIFPIINMILRYKFRLLKALLFIKTFIHYIIVVLQPAFLLNGWFIICYNMGETAWIVV